MSGIKYRVWSIENRTYHNPKEGCYYAMDEDGELSFYCHGDHCGSCEPEKYIIEQYTGLRDKNGKEIYEGDIVNIVAVVETDDSEMACIMNTNSIVCWDKEYARWDVNDEPEDKDWDYRRRRYFAFTSEDREDIEVIGNIHENPELLGGKE